MPNKKAFIVGINDYAPAGAGGPDLRGCVNDAVDMANTLVVCGFIPAGIRLCTNANATKANIVRGLEWLLAGANRGDSLVFYYSGHGSQIVDITIDEPDHRDEIICPHDINFPNKIYIVDDDLRKIFSRLPAGVNLEVIMDSCHAGTVTRQLFEGEEFPEEEKITIRYLPPPVEYTFLIDYQPDMPQQKLLKTESGKKQLIIVAGLNHTLWAACRDNQTSQETNMGGGVIRGVFTYHFCQVLRRTSGNIARRQLDSMVCAAIRRSGFVQIPQLETSAPEMMDKPFK